MENRRAIQMTTNFEGLIHLLADGLYSASDIFVRELIQNGHDGIIRRQAEERYLNIHGQYVETLTWLIRIAVDAGRLNDACASLPSLFRFHNAESLYEQYDRFYWFAYYYAARYAGNRRVPRGAVVSTRRARRARTGRAVRNGRETKGTGRTAAERRAAFLKRSKRRIFSTGRISAPVAESGGGGTYHFPALENRDALSGINAGDKVLVSPRNAVNDAGTFIAESVENSAAPLSEVTVIPAETETRLAEFFDFVRIHAEAEAAEQDIDTSDADPDVEEIENDEAQRLGSCA